MDEDKDKLVGLTFMLLMWRIFRLLIERNFFFESGVSGQLDKQLIKPHSIEIALLLIITYEAGRDG